MKGKRSIAFCLVLLFISYAESRIQTLKFANDDRSYIQLSSFGYLKGASLTMTMLGLKTKAEGVDHMIGFTFDKSSSEGRSSYVEHQENIQGCTLHYNGRPVHEDAKRAILRLENRTESGYVLAIYTVGLSGLKFKNGTSLTQDTTTTIISLTDQKSESKPDSADENKTAASNKNDPVPAAKRKNGETLTQSSEDKTTASNKNDPAPAAKRKNGETLTQSSEDKTTASNKNDPALEARKETDDTITKSSVNNITELKGEKSDPKQEPKSKPKSPTESIENTIEDGETASRARRSTPPQFEPQGFIAVTAVAAGDDDISFSLDLSATIETLEQEGLYELYFHNCRGGNGFKANTIEISGSINITETNEGNYLSAGDISLPILYAVMSSLFFFMAFQWISVLCVSTGKVFMVHYMMAVLVVIKGMSLAFHAIDLYFISKDGTPETWAIIFYVVHLFRGVLMFIILLLIGTGWAFIKYVLSDREKKVFMIVIPLQVFANIAYIVIQDTAESSKAYYTWKTVWMLVDVLCCGAILVPVVWSVRHLQEASQTDGKAAINLQKLKLFQHFYVMIICYLYFTRLIVYLLEITLPFQHIWIHMLFNEVGALIFFFLTGYQFRPGCDNPYLSIPQDDEEYVESLALTESGATENISRVNQHHQDDDEEDLLLPEWRVTAKSSAVKKFTSNV